MVRIEVVDANETQGDGFQEPNFRGWNQLKQFTFLLLKLARVFWKQLLGGVAVVIIIVAGIRIVQAHHNSGFPTNIKKKASFSIFYPQTSNGAIEVERPTVVYSNANNGLSYQVYVNSIEVVVTEQATPDIFNQAGVYDFKLSQAHEYASFDSSAGEVALTKPSDLKGQTVAWDNNHGTLLLAHAIQNLTLEQWKLLFNSLTTVN